MKENEFTAKKISNKEPLLSEDEVNKLLHRIICTPQDHKKIELLENNNQISPETKNQLSQQAILPSNKIDNLLQQLFSEPSKNKTED